MTVDESHRHALHEAARRAFGPDEATTLMEMLPPVGWADVATKRDLDQLRAEIRSDHRGDLLELRADLASQHLRLVMWMVGIWVATVTAFGIIRIV